ncbi:MAG TPA: hypothetical protein VMB50_23145 [Myxococcales bacterium]|nr:hypothetical protein [Myxococcales bacterium]
MIWRGLSVGPVLARDVRVGLERTTRVPVALRWFAAAPPASLPPLPWPPEPQVNVARLLRVEPSGGGVVLVSELALGPSLDLLLASPQPASVVAGLCLQMLAGLEALHAAGRAHGRLHPGNLVLDLRAGCLRIQDVYASAVEGVPRSGDARTLFVPPGRAGEPSAASDVYSVGRVAEALLRGGAPLLHWAPLPDARDPATVRLGSWISRCQSLDPREAFSGAAEARKALRELGAEGEQTLAHVRPGSWILARRRAERALGAWARRADRDAAGPADFADVVSSLRATAVWRRLGAAACGALLLSGALAARPESEVVPAAASAASRAELEALRAALLGAETDAGTPVADPLDAVALDAAAPALLAAAASLPGDAGAAATLPAEVAGPLRDVRLAVDALRAAELPCRRLLEDRAEAALAVGRPTSSVPLRLAVQRLAAQRLTDSDTPDAEAATRAALGLEDSPMLERAVDRVAGDPGVAKCIAALAQPAAQVREALAHSREALELTVGDGPSPPSEGSAP